MIHIVDGSLPDVLEAWRGINRELVLHEAGLEDKPQIVVINKIDMPEVQERLAGLRADFAAAGAEDVTAVSAVTGEGVVDLMEAALRRVESRREEERATRQATRRPTVDVILRPEPSRLAPVVEEQEDGVWRLHHPRLERLVVGVDFSDMGIAAQFWRELGHIGGIDALERAGAQPGDWVLIGESEVIWR